MISASGRHDAEEEVRELVFKQLPVEIRMQLAYDHRWAYEAFRQYMNMKLGRLNSINTRI